MLKMRIFEKKAVKSPQRRGAPPPNPRWPTKAGASLPDSRIVTFAYCCSFRRVRL